jgi:hypothetical protein
MIALNTLIALQAMDVISTAIALSGPAHEANPLLAKVMQKIGVLPTLIVIKGGFIGFLWYYQTALPDAALWLMCAGYVWVIYNNVQVIRGAKP